MTFNSLLHFIAVLFFSSSAYVQKNDPDPEIWMTIYCLPALFSLLFLLKPSLQYNDMMIQLEKIVALTYLVYAFWLLASSYETDMKLSGWLLHEEVGREFAGLLVASTWLLLISNASRKTTSFLQLFAFLVVVIPVCIWVFVYFNESMRRNWPSHCQSVAYADEN